MFSFFIHGGIKVAFESWVSQSSTRILLYLFVSYSPFPSPPVLRPLSTFLLACVSVSWDLHFWESTDIFIHPPIICWFVWTRSRPGELFLRFPYPFCLSVCLSLVSASWRSPIPLCFPHTLILTCALYPASDAPSPSCARPTIPRLLANIQAEGLRTTFPKAWSLPVRTCCCALLARVPAGCLCSVLFSLYGPSDGAFPH